MSLSTTWAAMAGAADIAWLVLRVTAPRAVVRYAWLNGMTMSRKTRTAPTMAPVGSRRRMTEYGIITARMATTKLSLPPATAPAAIAVPNSPASVTRAPGVRTWQARIAAVTTDSGTHSPITARYWL
jgi:hypothetical protein